MAQPAQVDHQLLPHCPHQADNAHDDGSRVRRQSPLAYKQCWYRYAEKTYLNKTYRDKPLRPNAYRWHNLLGLRNLLADKTYWRTKPIGGQNLLAVKTYWRTKPVGGQTYWRTRPIGRQTYRTENYWKTYIVKKVITFPVTHRGCR
jgi:hypothetical protein